MESMKNIKKPQYAVSMGRGLFKGYDDDEFATVWRCSRCLKRVRSNGEPSISGCPYGAHYWEEDN